jgi:hypothetical protein
MCALTSYILGQKCYKTGGLGDIMLYVVRKVLLFDHDGFN